MKTLGSARSSALIAAIWFASFATAICLTLALYLQRKIESDNLQAVLSKLSDLYAAHLGAILAFYFTAPAPGAPETRATSPAVLVAVVASILWNAIILIVLLAVTATLLPVEDATKLFEAVPPKLSWLIAPALGYFFALANKDFRKTLP